MANCLHAAFRVGQSGAGFIDGLSVLQEAMRVLEIRMWIALTRMVCPHGASYTMMQPSRMVGVWLGNYCATQFACSHGPEERIAAWTY